MQFNRNCFRAIFLLHNKIPITKFIINLIVTISFLKNYFNKLVNFILKEKGIYNQFNENQKYEAACMLQTPKQIQNNWCVTNNTKTNTTNSKDRLRESPSFKKNLQTVNQTKTSSN